METVLPCGGASEGADTRRIQLNAADLVMRTCGFEFVHHAPLSVYQEVDCQIVTDSIVFLGRVMVVSCHEAPGRKWRISVYRLRLTAELPEVRWLAA